MANYGVTDIENWSFDHIDLPVDWLEHLGGITSNARILVRGRAKNGKTEYVLRLSKALAQTVGKVNFNSTEQCKTSGFKKAVMRNKMQEVAGKFILCSPDQKHFETWFRKLQGKNTGKVVVIDSMDYMGLTFEQFKLLNNRFPNKMIVLVCWHDNKVSKKIEYMMDAIVQVKDFRAYCISREDGGKHYVILDKSPMKTNHLQPTLF